MEFLIGITGPGYVLVASDTLSVRSIMVLSSDSNKLHTLSPHQVFASVGESGETDRLKERLMAESSLATFRMGRPWSTKETAHFTRTLMADALRSRSPFQVHMLIAGVDEENNESGSSSHHDSGLQLTQKGPHVLKSPVASLYWMDYLAALHLLPYAAHGYGAYFTWGLLDARYKPNLTVEESIYLLADVLGELSDRFIIHIPRLALKLIDAEGVKDIEVKWSDIMQRREAAKSASVGTYSVSWKSLSDSAQVMMSS